MSIKPAALDGDSTQLLKDNVSLVCDLDRRVEEKAKEQMHAMDEREKYLDSREKEIALLERAAISLSGEVVALREQIGLILQAARLLHQSSSKGAYPISFQMEGQVDISRVAMSSEYLEVVYNKK